MEEDFVDTDKVYIKEIQASVAKDIIVKNHYSHAWTMCSLAIGVFYKSDTDHDFFDVKDDKLIGCMVFGCPVGRSAAASFSEEVDISEVWELTRLWIADSYGKNIESYCIGAALRHIKRNHNRIKVIMSYADSEQGHQGGIYKATNAYYQGTAIALMPNFSVSLTKEPYKWIHSRTVSERYGSHNVEKLKKAVGATFWRKKESGKHRYFWIMTNKKERKSILNTLKHKCVDYPSDANTVDPIITQHDVEPITSQFFE